jgi:hypothetical protein
MGASPLAGTASTIVGSLWFGLSFLKSGSRVVALEDFVGSDLIREPDLPAVRRGAEVEFDHDNLPCAPACPIPDNTRIIALTATQNSIIYADIQDIANMRGPPRRVPAWVLEQISLGGGIDMSDLAPSANSEQAQRLSDEEVNFPREACCPEAKEVAHE